MTSPRVTLSTATNEASRAAASTRKRLKNVVSPKFTGTCEARLHTKYTLTIHTLTHVYIYIYINYMTERERQTDRQRDRQRASIFEVDAVCCMRSYSAAARRSCLLLSLTYAASPPSSSTLLRCSTAARALSIEMRSCWAVRWAERATQPRRRSQQPAWPVTPQRTWAHCRATACHSSPCAC